MMTIMNKSEEEQIEIFEHNEIFSEVSCLHVVQDLLVAGVLRRHGARVRLVDVWIFDQRQEAQLTEMA